MRTCKHACKDKASCAHACCKRGLDDDKAAPATTATTATATTTTTAPTAATATTATATTAITATTAAEFSHKPGPAFNINLLQSHVYVWAVYLISIPIAIFACVLLQPQGVLEGGAVALEHALIADVVVTLVLWCASLLCNNSSVYDPYWSLAPPALVAYWQWMQPERHTRHAFIIVVVVVWAVRLTRNWAIDWPGLGHEDFRYVEIRKTITHETGLPASVYWLAGSLGAIMLLPTALVFAALLPAYYAISTPTPLPLSSLDWFALALGVGAAALQFIADAQMRAFRASCPPPSACIDTGVWRFSRHPNYFGEICFWASLALFGLASGGCSVLAAVAGACAMIALFVFASVPLMEARQLGGARGTSFRQYQREVSMLIPMPRFGSKHE